MKQLHFLEGLGAPESLCLLKATMLSPSDKTLRKQFFAHFSALDIVADPRLRKSTIEIPAWIVVGLADPNPGQNLARRIEVADMQGRAAGELLFLYYSLHHIATRTQSDFQKEDSFSALKKEIAIQRGKSDAWLEKSWRAFKPVAHLWASAYVESCLLPGDEGVLQEVNARRFIASATLIERFAVSYIPARQHVPLFDLGKTISVEGSVTEEELLLMSPVLEGLLRSLATQ